LRVLVLHRFLTKVLRCIGRVPCRGSQFSGFRIEDKTFAAIKPPLDRAFVSVDPVTTNDGLTGGRIGLTA
jgi:hypothetical protein